MAGLLAFLCVIAVAAGLWIPITAAKAFVVVTIAKWYAVPFVSVLPFYQVFGSLAVFSIYSMSTSSGSDAQPFLRTLAVVLGLLIALFLAWLGTFFIHA